MKGVVSVNKPPLNCDRKRSILLTLVIRMRFLLCKNLIKLLHDKAYHATFLDQHCAKRNIVQDMTWKVAR